jgi:hypothetical protein
MPYAAATNTSAAPPTIPGHPTHSVRCHAPTYPPTQPTAPTRPPYPTLYTLHHPPTHPPTSSASNRLASPLRPAIAMMGSWVRL